MEDEQKQVEIASEQKTDTNEVYLNAITELKNNTVSREEYERVKADNKRLLDSLVNGAPAPVEPKQSIDLDALRKEIFVEHSNLNNLEYWQKVLQLRSEIIAQGGNDPFLPYGKKISPTEQDEILADRVAEVVQDCIEYANGDSEVFTNELQRRTNDVRR